MNHEEHTNDTDTDRLNQTYDNTDNTPSSFFGKRNERNDQAPLTKA